MSQNTPNTVQIEEKANNGTEQTLDEECVWKEDVTFFAELSSEEVKTQKKTDCEQARIEEVQKKQVGEVTSQSNELDQEIRAMVSGYPLESMVPAISHFDRGVAGLIVGIAKKESNWGKRVPTKNGEDCYNYWGYKGAGTRGVSMGHGCFGSPEEAVSVVGGRIQELVQKRQGSEPSRMVVWKCGSSCATHSPESVSKWVSDVNIYYRQIANN